MSTTTGHPSSPGRVLVRTGGFLNAALAIFHVVLCVQIWHDFGKQPVYPLLQMFSLSGSLFVTFLAVTSLACAAEMVATRMGLYVLALNVILYMLRAIGEVVLFPQPKPVIIILCVGIAAVYLAAVWQVTVASRQSARGLPPP